MRLLLLLLHGLRLRSPLLLINIRFLDVPNLLLTTIFVLWIFLLLSFQRFLLLQLYCLFSHITWLVSLNHLITLSIFLHLLILTLTLLSLLLLMTYNAGWSRGTHMLTGLKESLRRVRYDWLALRHELRILLQLLRIHLLHHQLLLVPIHGHLVLLSHHGCCHVRILHLLIVGIWSETLRRHRVPHATIHGGHLHHLLLLELRRK